MKVSKDVTAGTWTEEDRRITAEERRASLESLETFVKSANDEVGAILSDFPTCRRLFGRIVNKLMLRPRAIG